MCHCVLINVQEKDIISVIKKDDFIDLNII